MAALPHDYEDGLKAHDTFHVFSHFAWFATTDEFTSVLTDTGTASVGDAVGGVLALVPSDGTVADNDEAYVKTTHELFLVADDKPIRFECRAQYAEAATNAANIFVGLCSAIAANALVDDGGGMRASGNLFVFVKVDGGTTWQAVSRNGSSVKSNDTGVTAGGAAYQKFRIEIDNQGDGSVNARVTFWIDDVICKDVNTNLPIVHFIPISGSTEMNAGAGVKNGSGSLETLNLDYLYAGQKV